MSVIVQGQSASKKVTIDGKKVHGKINLRSYITNKYETLIGIFNDYNYIRGHESMIEHGGNLHIVGHYDYHSSRYALRAHTVYHNDENVYGYAELSIDQSKYVKNGANLSDINELPVDIRHIHTIPRIANPNILSFDNQLHIFGSDVYPSFGGTGPENNHYIYDFDTGWKYIDSNSNYLGGEVLKYNDTLYLLNNNYFAYCKNTNTWEWEAVESCPITSLHSGDGYCYDQDIKYFHATIYDSKIFAFSSNRELEGSSYVNKFKYAVYDGSNWTTSVLPICVYASFEIDNILYVVSRDGECYKLNDSNNEHNWIRQNNIITLSDIKMKNDISANDDNVVDITIEDITQYKNKIYCLIYSGGRNLVSNNNYDTYSLSLFELNIGYLIEDLE